MREQQSSRCISRVFVSECAPTVGCGAAGEGRKRGRDGVYAAATLIQVSHQKSPFSFKLAQSTVVLDSCQRTPDPLPDFFFFLFTMGGEKKCFQQQIFLHIKLIDLKY